MAAPGRAAGHLCSAVRGALGRFFGEEWRGKGKGGEGERGDRAEEREGDGE